METIKSNEIKYTNINSLDELKNYLDKIPNESFSQEDLRNSIGIEYDLSKIRSLLEELSNETNNKKLKGILTERDKSNYMPEIFLLEILKKVYKATQNINLIVGLVSKNPSCLFSDDNPISSPKAVIECFCRLSEDGIFDLGDTKEIRRNSNFALSLEGSHQERKMVFKILDKITEIPRKNRKLVEEGMKVQTKEKRRQNEIKSVKNKIESLLKSNVEERPKQLLESYYYSSDISDTDKDILESEIFNKLPLNEGMKFKGEIEAILERISGGGGKSDRGIH
jgi:hypothetical protein